MKIAATICLAAYLIFTGIATLFSLQFQGEPVVLGLLALAAGVLALLGGIDWPTRTPPNP